MVKIRGYSLVFLLCLVVLLAYVFDIFFVVDYTLKDYWYQSGGGVPSSDIHVIGIDGETLEALGPFEEWSREGIAELITLLNTDEATKSAVIGVDVMFFGDKSREVDQALVEALSIDDNVVVANQAVFGGQIVEETADTVYMDYGYVNKLYEPFEALKRVSRQGHINGVVDRDNILRQSLHYVVFDGRIVYSFPYQVYRLYAEKKGIDAVDPSPYLDKENKWDIPYRAKPNQYFGEGLQGTSLVRVLNGEVDPKVFAGDIVLIGPFANGMMDGYYTPVDKMQKMYGVEVHANTIQAFLEKNFKQRVPKVFEGFMLITLMLVVGYILQTHSVKSSAKYLMVILITYGIGAKIAYLSGWIITLFYPVAVVFIFYIAKVWVAYIKEYKEKKKIIEAFRCYIAPQVLEKLIQEGYKTQNMIGENKDVAVFFIDIRGFTSLSEEAPPREVVEVLNECLKLTTETIFKYEGMVDKFIGDATMGIFNAPMMQEDYVYKSVKCAMEILEEAKKLNQRVYERYNQSIELGIGMSCGECIVGNIGAANRVEYTAIGDVVNTASRLEALAKGSELIITEEVYKRLQGRIDVIDYGEHKLKGKANKVKVYCVQRLID